MTVAIKKMLGLARMSTKKIAGLSFEPTPTSLLHMDGTDASTTFSDVSGKTWTAVGNAQIDTAQSVFGGASALFDGTGDAIRSAYTTDWQPGTGDFTIDFRIRFASVTGTPYPLWIGSDGNYNGGMWVFLSSSYLYFGFANAAYTQSYTVNFDATVTTNTWYHVAWVRSGGAVRLYRDGTKQTTAGSSSIDISGAPSNPLVSIGAQYGSQYMGNSLNGWIDEFRYIKGVARWTDSFTPATAAYPANQLKKFAGLSNV